MEDIEFYISLSVAVTGLLIVSSLKIFPDPYYHIEKVNVWEWLIREIDELFTGERE